jgi:hypothetical protein
VLHAAIFGVERRPAAVLPSLASLLALSLASCVVLAWRVAAPMRA